jgi:hypothetical protein
MAIAEQKKKLLKAKIAVALQDELGRIQRCCMDRRIGCSTAGAV